MKYVGIHTQQATNNFKSLLLLLLFPCIMLGMVYLFLVIINYLGVTDYAYEDAYGPVSRVDWDYVNYEMMHILPWVIIIVGIWFVIAYFSNTAMIRHATGARPLERRENPRVYNIVENLTMSCGMPMPKINVIDDPQLNAFASGEDNARHIGVNVKRVKLIILVTVSALIGVCVSISGTVSFVGLVMPHIARMLVGPNHRRLLPAAMFAGAIFLLLADLAARTLLSPIELSIGVVTSLVGAVAFVLIFARTRKGGA